MNKKGFFITFEGIDGCGKTTQLKLAEEYLSARSMPLLILREPGSTPLSEKIRNILLNKELKINPISELMLYVAARAELVKDVIASALNAGRIVLCDRFYDSTTAYQGYGRGIDIDLIRRIHQLTVANSQPNLTFLIDLDYDTSLTRRKEDSDRLESESREFFDRVREGFLDIALKEPKRIIVLDGRQPIHSIFDEVKSCLREKLRLA